MKRNAIGAAAQFTSNIMDHAGAETAVGLKTRTDMHDWQSIPMPPAIAARPKTKQGFPIPFVNYVYPNGEADLRVLDDRKVSFCVGQRLCAICGLSLGREIVFVGGPACSDSRCFLDPAMHEECARYAIAVCPFLACQNYHHAMIEKPRRDDPGAILVANPLAPPGGTKRPEKMMICFTNGFRWILAQGGTRAIRAYAPTRIEWF